jgi:hypothetical protein
MRMSQWSIVETLYRAGPKTRLGSGGLGYLSAGEGSLLSFFVRHSVGFSYVNIPWFRDVG